MSNYRLSKDQRRVPLAFLHECFAADFDRGVLTWRDRPSSHFKNESARMAWREHCYGKPVGSLNAGGYLCVQATYKGQPLPLLVHRVLFAMRAGAWPEKHVDHIDGDRRNNRGCNLREATRYENAQNQRGPSRHNTVGLLGVTRARRGRFLAQITANGKNHRIGTFDTPEEAHAAYVSAKRRLHQGNTL